MARKFWVSIYTIKGLHFLQQIIKLNMYFYKVFFQGMMNLEKTSLM